MKTIGRVLVILVVFLVVAGLMFAAGAALGPLAARFDGERNQFRPAGEGVERLPRQEDEGFRSERGGEGRGGMNILRLLFGGAKNVFVIGLLVALIVFPKSIIRQNKRKAAANSSDVG